MEWLTKFEELLKLSDVYSDMNPPARIENIRNFEKALNEEGRVKDFSLPPSYVAFLSRYDGGSVADNDAGAYPHFLTVLDYESPWQSLMNYNAIDSVLMDHEIETYFTFEPLVMIAMDEGGSFWALDPREQREDGEMPIRYCDHETGDIYAQSEDFAAFILALATRQLQYRELDIPIIKGQSF